MCETPVLEFQCWQPRWTKNWKNGPSIEQLSIFICYSHAIQPASVQEHRQIGNSPRKEWHRISRFRHQSISFMVKVGWQPFNSTMATLWFWGCWGSLAPHLVGKYSIPGSLAPPMSQGFFTPFLLSALSPCREPDLHSVSGSTKSEISRSEKYRMDQTITTNKTGKTRLTWNALTPRTDVAFTVTTPRTLEVPLNTSVCMKIIP